MPGGTRQIRDSGRLLSENKILIERIGQLEEELKSQPVKEVIVEKIIEKPVEVIVERIVEKPVEKIVEKVIERSADTKALEFEYKRTLDKEKRQMYAEMCQEMEELDSEYQRKMELIQTDYDQHVDQFKVSAEFQEAEIKNMKERISMTEEELKERDEEINKKNATIKNLEAELEKYRREQQEMEEYTAKVSQITKQAETIRKKNSWDRLSRGQSASRLSGSSEKSIREEPQRRLSGRKLSLRKS